MDQRKRETSLRDSFANVVAAAEASGAFSAATSTRFVATAERFVSFCGTGNGLVSLSEVTPSIADAFIRAPVDGRPVSVARMHSRRTGLRAFFRFARELGLLDGDPSLDIRLPARSNRRTRPLTDDEVALCRSYALTSLTETRHAAVWALAEATARTAEIPHIRAVDLDLPSARVWVHGGRRTPERWGELSDWGIKQLERRVRTLRRDDVPLVYAGTRGGESAQASSSTAIADALRRAGLDREPDLGPPSVAAWAGRKLLERGARIEEVAARLGLRSLDRAALLIGWDWHQGRERT
jgi:integrase/recombinase XerC